LCPKQQPKLLENPRFRKPFMVEFPMWAAVGISVEHWNDKCYPTEDYQFHLWLPDVAMQMNYKNAPCVILPDLYCLNDQQLKAKYDINPNSAQGAMQGNARHFGEYGPHLTNWRKRWGWDYENTATYAAVADNYSGTLIGVFGSTDLITFNGPLLVP